MEIDPADPPPLIERPARSRLAMASAAMGLAALPLVCCGAGFSGAMAVLLGMMALDRIRASGGALRGRGLAWTGIISGIATVALSVAWISFVSNLWDAWVAQLDRGVRTTFQTTEASGGQAALALWGPSPGAIVSAQDIVAFASDARSRYGEFDSLQLVSRDVVPSLTGDHMVTFVVNFEFAKGRRSGVVNARLTQPATTSGGWAPALEIASILINEPEAERGMIVFPKPARDAKPAAATTEAGANNSPMKDAESKQP